MITFIGVLTCENACCTRPEHRVAHAETRPVHRKTRSCIAVHRLCIATRVGDVAVHRRWFGCALRVPPRAGSNTRRTASMSPVITDARRCVVPCTACAWVITAGGSSWCRRGDRYAVSKRNISCTGCVSRVCSVGLGRVGGLPARWARPLLRHCDDDDDDLRAVGRGRCLTTRIPGCQRGLGEGFGAYGGAQNVPAGRPGPGWPARRPLESAT